MIDRGGDRNVLSDRLLGSEKKKEFIVRLVGNRHLHCGRQKKEALELARGC